MNDNSINQLFDFTPEELELNNKGNISDRQRSRLGSARGALIASVTMYVILALMLFAAAIALPFLSFLASLDAMIRTAIPLTLAFVALVFLAAAGNKILRSRALISTSLHTADGTADLHIREYRSNGVSLGKGWFVKLGGEEFRLANAAQYGAISKGTRYRVHHIDDYPVKIILSLEITN